jgi:hypothetical protein
MSQQTEKRIENLKKIIIFLTAVVLIFSTVQESIAQNYIRCFDKDSIAAKSVRENSQGIIIADKEFSQSLYEAFRISISSFSKYCESFTS